MPFVLVLLTAAAGAAGFQAPPARPAAPAGNLIHGCVEKFDPTADYFPDKIAVEDAVNFSVSYHRAYKVVDVHTTKDGSRERYVLSQCGAPLPALQGELAGAQVVRVPIASLYSQSTTHLGSLVDLHRLDVLTGVSMLKRLIGDEILKRASSGQVHEFSPTGVIDTELVVSQRPSVLMTGGSLSAELSVIKQAGVPVVANSEWLEPTALARGEWLKYMALFLNEERNAQHLFADVKGRYRALSARAIAIPADQQPTVMAGRGTHGDFVIAGGRSYAAALVRDAGGRYVWSDDTATGSVTLDLEAQLKRAGNADIWINGGGWANRAAMVKDEPRYGLFKAYRTGQVWVYERAVNAAGANDYWSGAVSHPDLVLADLVKILHPALVPNHQFHWYMPVPQ